MKKDTAYDILGREWVMKDDGCIHTTGMIHPELVGIKKGKTMDSAKKSVEKILEIAKKHGYACVVGFKKIDGEDMDYGITGPLEDCNKITQKAFEFSGDKDGE